MKDEEAVDSEGFSIHYAKHEGAAQKYDAFAEFDMWHGEHAFVARMISDYVKKKYKFEGSANDHRNSKDKVFPSPFEKCHIRDNREEEGGVKDGKEKEKLAVEPIMYSKSESERKRSKK